MSERYGKCETCKGEGQRANEECGECWGTGISGDASRLDEAGDLPRQYTLTYQRNRGQRQYALERAVQAIVENVFRVHSKEKTDGKK